MIQQKKATDYHLYQRALKAAANGDDTMKPIIDWYERGCKPKPKGTQAHREAHKVIVELKKTHTMQALADKFDTYITLIARLYRSEYNAVPESKAQQIAEMGNFNLNE